MNVDNGREGRGDGQDEGINRQDTTTTTTTTTDHGEGSDGNDSTGGDATEGEAEDMREHVDGNDGGGDED